MKKDLKYDDMLIQIREMIQPQPQKIQKSKYLNNSEQESNRNKLSFNIESIIEESSRIISQNKFKSNNKQINRGKILAANQLLKEQTYLPPFVKRYVKQKIQSEIFSIEPSKVLTKEQIERFQRQKQIIIREREQEIKTQRQRRSKLVKDIKEFDHSKNVKISVHEIDSLIFNEEPTSSYLLKITPNNRNKILSKSNEVKNSNLFISEVYEQQQNEEKKIIQDKKSELIQRHGQDIDDQYDDEYKVFQQEAEGLYNDINESQNQNLKQNLIKYPHFVKIFALILEKQYKIMSLTDQIRNSSTIREKQMRMSKQISQQSFKWTNRPKKYISKPINNQKDSNISTIVKKYRFKAFLINQKKQQYSEKDIVTQKRVNKMSGESKNFHLKHCILTKNQLIYYNEGNKKEMKRIQIPLQKIQIQKGLKQQGSFFSKKLHNIEIVNLKSKISNFKYQKGSLEGQDFYIETIKLMSRKVFDLICKKNGSNSLYLKNFILNENSQNFKLSDNIFRFIQDESSIEQRKHLLSIICDLFPIRKEVENIQMIKSKLFPNQINFILNQCNLINKLKKIDLSFTRILKHNFSELCKLVSNLKDNTKIQVILKGCKLDDQVFSSNIGIFISFSSKVKFLDISSNNFTSKSLQIFKNCLDNISSQILHLIISFNPIKQLGKISNMIKGSRKLQYLSAQDCDLLLQKRSNTQIQAFFEFLKKQNSLKSLKLGLNGRLSSQKIKIIQNSWTNQSFKILQIDVNFENTKQASNLNVQFDNNIFGVLNYQIKGKLIQLS